ncbi:MAG: hypothetical protein AB7L90_18890 [Hyphomicrobiaceae bacterium]
MKPFRDNRWKSTITHLTYTEMAQAGRAPFDRSGLLQVFQDVRHFLAERSYGVLLICSASTNSKTWTPAMNNGRSNRWSPGR